MEFLSLLISAYSRQTFTRPSVETDYCRIESDPLRFGVASVAGADGFIVGIVHVPAHEAGYHFVDTFQSGEHGLQAPKSATGERDNFKFGWRGMVFFQTRISAPTHQNF